jgi:hypothetical protein
MAREVAVAGHLAARDAPVVAPTANPSPGPHRTEDAVVTFWRFVEHDPDHRPDPEVAGSTFRVITDRLRDYVGPLPRWEEAIDECARRLTEPTAPLNLTVNDKNLLRREHRGLRRLLTGASGRDVVLHGDAHLGNALCTREGVLWTDFESACFGPIEWDMSALPEGAWAHFPDANRQLLSNLCRLRSFCVIVWCAAQPEPPDEVSDALIFHLDRLRRQHGNTGVSR